MPKAARIRHGKHNSSVKLPHSFPTTIEEAQSLKIPNAEKKISETSMTQSEPDGPEFKAQQSKKAKQFEKREAFLQKFSLSSIQGSKSHQKRMKRKAKEQLTGGLSDLQTALVTLEKDVLAQQEPLTTISTSQDEAKAEPAARPGTIGKGLASTLSKAQRKRVLELERLRHPLILTNSEFSANPFQTIRTHAQNTLLTLSAKGKP